MPHGEASVVRRSFRLVCALLACGLLGASIAPRIGAADPAGGGQRLWAALYNGPKRGDDVAAALAVSPQGSLVFVTGTSEAWHTSSNDYATVAYDAATGAQVWVSRYDGPADGYDEATDVGVSPDGSKVFVTGRIGQGPTSDDYATVAYDAATGSQLWASRYDGPGHSYDYAFALAVNPDGSIVFVTGTGHTGNPTLGDFGTVAYDAATGTELWVSRYNGPGNGYDDGNDIEVSPDGSIVYVTGDSEGEGVFTNNDYATVAYDTVTGSELWVSRYDGPGDHDLAYALGVSSDGATVFVTGISEQNLTGDDYATVAYDAITGDELWASRYDAAGATDGANALAVSPDGSTVFVTGNSLEDLVTGTDYATVAYDAGTGSELWVARGGGVGLDVGHAIGVHPNGSTVFIAATRQWGALNTDYISVAYDAATGADLWAGLARRPRYDYPFDLGVSPDGSAVFITGYMQVRQEGTTDYGTVAFST